MAPCRHHQLGRLVNGKGAALDRNGRFFVDNVQVQPGANTVTLLLNTLDGAPVARTINVGSTGAAPFQVTLDPQEGLAPLSATMTITNRGNVAFQRIEIDINDDGTPEQTVPACEQSGGAGAELSQSGIYKIRVKAFDIGDVSSIRHSGTSWLAILAIWPGRLRVFSRECSTS